MPASEAVILPKNVIPQKYTLKLQPNFQDFTFQGEETIDIAISESTSEILLNSSDIEIHSAALVRDGVTTAASGISYAKAVETAAISFPQPIVTGTAQIVLKFTGILNDKLRGFYRSQYITEQGETKYLATTQFEATDARQAFPCWDEPARKAKFECTLVVPEDMVAISNTPMVASSPSGAGLKSVRFAETPVMSTYLLAFVIGDLTHIEKEAASGTRVGVWTTRGKEEQGRFALDTSVKLLSFFNDYFGIPYPLEKLDHIAIPDFAAGAMENWGAVTYRETALLVDPQNSSAGTRQRVAEVVAHEMAHMWFGDLVTMTWWDDLWLNESFASWMGTKAVDWLFPEWQMWTQFVNMDTNRALSLDGLKNSHPIEQEVKDPAEVSQLFDAISYSKGASVIRMLEQFLTPEVFRQGLYRYLSAHQYQNAQTKDLWSALEEASKQPVTSIMNTWTGQMGYPVLDVTARQSGGQTEITLSQQRFVYDSLLGEGEPEATTWRVPIRVAASGDAPPVSLVMNERQASISLASGTGPQQWFKVNPLQTGFYRVNYSAEDWERLVPAIESLALPATDRLGIQNDAYALSRAGLLPVTQFLSLARAYENENDASVWSDLASNLREIETLIAQEPYHGEFQTFARNLFQPAARRIGWEARTGEGHLDALLRSTVLSQAGNYQDAEVLRQASEQFASYLQEPASVRPDLRGVVYSLAAQAGDESTYQQLWDLERRAGLQEEKIRLLISLARFSQPELLQETLERALTPDVRSQDTITVISAVAGNIRGREPAWNFVKNNWGELDRRYGGGGFGIMRLVSITNNFAEMDKLTEVETFFQEHPAPAAERTIRQALERIRLNATWVEKNRSELGQWFSK
ncbi:MAG: M1 family metallopeptidase [Chloroflexi bacterium]|nr:M1 family metallopeptidase [Chloroflexota bacterium]MDA1217864.1 M1 family metallopeptidase [Chloroflexota bacterium]